MTVPELEPWGSSALTEKVFCEYASRRETHWVADASPDAHFRAMSRHVLDFRLLWEQFPEEARTTDVLDALCGVKYHVDALICSLKATEINGMREKK
jgi:hypothetical protein